MVAFAKASRHDHRVTMTIDLLILALLILLNGMFAMSELAIVSARRARLQQRAEERHVGARVALELLENPGRFLSTVQTGITVTGIVAGAYGGATLSDGVGEWLAQFSFLASFAHQVGFGLVVTVITFLSLLIGELAPKRIALNYAEEIAVVMARPMLFFARVAAPLVWLLEVSSDGVLRLLRLQAVSTPTVTEEEVKLMVAEGTRRGVFEPAEHKMIEGVLRLSDRTVRAIMTPRPAVAWLDISMSAEDLSQELRKGGHARYPVCRGDVDDVLGIAQARDLFDQLLEGRSLDLTECLVKPLIVHDRTQVLRLLDLFRQASQRLAIVVDEYGSFEGIVSVTDVLESIAGDLPEEMGQPVDDSVVRREDGSWLVDGMLPIDEVEARLGVRGLRDDGDYHTLAGFVLTRLGHVPVASEHFLWRGVYFEVMDMDGRRIDKVLVRLAPLS
ncbi:putative hemolysin [Azospirillaceae bacterium]